MLKAGENVVFMTEVSWTTNIIKAVPRFLDGLMEDAYEVLSSWENGDLYVTFSLVLLRM